jgi:hypothetical protein
MHRDTSHKVSRQINMYYTNTKALKQYNSNIHARQLDKIQSYVTQPSPVNLITTDNTVI